MGAAGNGRAGHGDTSQVAGKVPDGNPIKVAVSDDSSYAVYNSENIDFSAIPQ